MAGLLTMIAHNLRADLMFIFKSKIIAHFINVLTSALQSIKVIAKRNIGEFCMYHTVGGDNDNIQDEKCYLKDK